MADGEGVDAAGAASLPLAAGAYGWLGDRRYDAGLDELAALEVAEARLLARRARVLSALASGTSRTGWQGEAPFASLLLDVAGTCVLGQVAAGSRLTDAEHLVLRLPGALELLDAGRLRVHQLRVLVEQTRELSAATCAELERRVLPRIEPLCPADLRRLLKRLVLQLESEDAQAAREAEQRRRQARSDRRTWVRPGQDGMAVFGAVLPAEQAQQLQARLTEQARQVRATGDGRGVDQLRADLLAGEALGPACGTCDGRARPRPSVQVVVHVPLAVALGLSDAPAELEGYGPISAAHARRLLPGAELRRACIDPDTGRVWALDDGTVRLPDPAHGLPIVPVPVPVAAPVSSQEAEAGRVPTDDPRPPRGPDDRASARGRGGGETADAAVRSALLALAALPPPVPKHPEARHDPSPALARLVRARHVRCDGLGCSVPGRRCELDHHVRWPDGATSTDNLRPRSQRCHHAKHTGWGVALSEAGTTWTSPGGRRYLVPDRTPVHLPGGLRPWRPDEGDGESGGEGHGDGHREGPGPRQPEEALDLDEHHAPRVDGGAPAPPPVDLRGHGHVVVDDPAPF